MASETITNLRNWFRSCPELKTGKKVGVDYLSESPTEYAIYAVPSTLKTHENILGEEVLDDIQTVNYIFASKEVYGADARQNMANLEFYQRVGDWIIKQNAEGNFPEWAGTIKSILPTLTAYPAKVGSSAAKYQIQMKITYRRN